MLVSRNRTWVPLSNNSSADQLAGNLRNNKQKVYLFGSHVGMRKLAQCTVDNFSPEVKNSSWRICSMEGRLEGSAFSSLVIRALAAGDTRVDGM